MARAWILLRRCGFCLSLRGQPQVNPSTDLTLQQPSLELQPSKFYILESVAGDLTPSRNSPMTQAVV
jgi:hypothetical protein